MASARNVGGLEARYAALSPGMKDLYGSRETPMEQFNVNISHETPMRGSEEDMLDGLYHVSPAPSDFCPSDFEDEEPLLKGGLQKEVGYFKDGRWRVSCLMILVFAALLGVMAGVVIPIVDESSDDDDASSSTLAVLDGCGSADSHGYVTCSYEAESFSAFGSVRTWLANQTNGSISDYVPRRLEVKYNAALMAPGVTATADLSGGYVAYGLYLPTDELDDGRVPVNGSFLVVQRANGSLVAVTPTSALDGSERSTHMDAVKLYSPSHVLASSDEWGQNVGHAYLWNWRRASYEGDTSGETHLRRVSAERRYSSLDVQWSEDNATWWQPTGAADEPAAFSQFDVATGDELQSFAVPVCGGLNHVQLYDNDTKALLSCGGSNSIVMYDVSEGEVVFVAGGENGTLPVVDLTGYTHAPGETVWAGQYNAEYYGSDVIALFDNRYDVSDAYPNQSSRVLLLRERDDVVTVEFAYDLRDAFPYGFSRAFGDADILPSTNVLAAWWPAALSPSRGDTFDAQLVEVTMDQEVAWQMSVYGDAEDTCTADGDASCQQAIDRGWKIYAVERFYDAPLVYNATFVRLENESTALLSFAAHTAFKIGYKTHGRWALLSDELGGGSKHGTFKFEAHWAPTIVKVQLSNITRLVKNPSSLNLQVLDEYDQSTTLVIPYGV